MDYFLYTNNPNNLSYYNEPSSSPNEVKPEEDKKKNKKKYCKKMKGPTPREVKLSTDPQSVAARERRHRISERFKILQSLVPGGSKMDTVSMLEEAIQYVKFLKTQIWWLNHQPLDHADQMQQVVIKEEEVGLQVVDQMDSQVGFPADYWAHLSENIDHNMHFGMGAFIK